MSVDEIKPAIVRELKRPPPQGNWRAMHYDSYKLPVLVYDDGCIWSVRYSRWCHQKRTGAYPTLSNTLVHQLVLCAFRGPPKAGEECRHLDGNPTNNRIENLVWGDPKENYQDRIRHGTHNARPKKLALQSKARIIAAVDISTAGRRSLAQQFGLSESYVYALLRNAGRMGSQNA